jgi:hypothetical protein
MYKTLISLPFTVHLTCSTFQTEVVDQSWRASHAHSWTIYKHCTAKREVCACFVFNMSVTKTLSHRAVLLVSHLFTVMTDSFINQDLIFYLLLWIWLQILLSLCHFIFICFVFNEFFLLVMSHFWVSSLAYPKLLGTLKAFFLIVLLAYLSFAYSTSCNVMLYQGRRVSTT